MRAADIELSKRLYELSGWKSDWMYWKRLIDPPYSPAKVLRSGAVTTRDGYMVCYAYDLNYLLGQIPRELDNKVLELVPRTADDSWYVGYSSGIDFDGFDMGIVWASGPTPEDAVAQLAIKLFEEGVMKK